MPRRYILKGESLEDVVRMLGDWCDRGDRLAETCDLHGTDDRYRGLSKSENEKSRIYYPDSKRERKEKGEEKNG